MTELEEIAAQIEEHKRQCYESGDPVQIWLADNFDEIDEEVFRFALRTSLHLSTWESHSKTLLPIQ